MGNRSPSRALRPVKRSMLFFILPLSFSSLVSTASSPFPAANDTKTTGSSLLLPTNVSTLAAPPPPRGFEVDINYDCRKTFSPLGVYLCAIGLMYQVAQAGWHEPLVGALTVWSSGFDVEIDIESSRGAHGSVPLETVHIVSGLYETIVDVVAQSRFCEVHTTLLLHRRQIGILLLQKRSPTRTLATGGANATSSVSVDSVAQENAVVYPSGTFTDPDDAAFSLSYTYSGVRINSKDIFLAVLDALATAAQFSRVKYFQSLTAVSPSGSCAISIVANLGSIFRVNYSFVTKALRFLIVDVMVPLGKFEGLTLQLKWETSEMAEMSVRLGDHGTAAQ